MWYFGKVKNTEEWGFDVFEKTFDNPIELTDEERDSIIEQASKEGKFIVGDKDGKPILVDPPKPTEEEVIRARVKELERYLEGTDWYAIRFADTGEPIPEEIKKRRQDARDEISELKNQLS